MSAVCAHSRALPGFEMQKIGITNVNVKININLGGVFYGKTKEAFMLKLK